MFLFWLGIFAQTSVPRILVRDIPQTYEEWAIHFLWSAIMASLITGGLRNMLDKDKGGRVIKA